MSILFSFSVDFFIYNYGGLVNIKRERQNVSNAPRESSKWAFPGR
jgi:hypothetical protein